MEYSLAWASKMEVKLLVTLLSKQHSASGGLRSVLSRASRVKLGVSDLTARGTLRVALRPLLDELPVAGGIKVGCCRLLLQHSCCWSQRGLKGTASRYLDASLCLTGGLQVSFLGSPDFSYDINMLGGGCECACMCAQVQVCATSEGLALPGSCLGAMRLHASTAAC